MSPWRCDLVGIRAGQGWRSALCPGNKTVITTAYQSECIMATPFCPQMGRPNAIADGATDDSFEWYGSSVVLPSQIDGLGPIVSMNDSLVCYWNTCHIL
jgi:hypothetical protein